MAMIRVALSTLTLAATPALAQRAQVTLVASLNNETGKALPVIGRFWFVALDSRDSVPALTDGTGRAQLFIAPGSYQVRSHQRVTLAGRAWYWDVPVSVRGATQVELTNANAQDAPPSAAPGSLVMESPDDPAPVSAVTNARSDLTRRLKPGDPGYKDPGLAVLFGILLAGGGHFYAGEIDKGLGILAGVVLGASLFVSQYCDGYSYDCNDTVAGIGGLLLLGSWIYSIADAAPAAGRANRREPSFSLSPLPGQRVGLAVRLPL